MKFSCQKLSRYFAGPLPPPDALAEAITLRAFEVESAEGDWLDIKILPERLAEVKTELGMAREIAAIFDLPLKAEYLNLPTGDTARTKIRFKPEEINSILGLNLPKEEINVYLRRSRVVVEGSFALVPPERQDLNIVEDLADEVGRLYGVNNFEPEALPASPRLKLNPDFVLIGQVRRWFLDRDYTELYTTSLTAAPNPGAEIEKPRSEHYRYLRSGLAVAEKVRSNFSNLLFDDQPVKLFEIGKVFPGGREELAVGAAIGYKRLKYRKERLPFESSDLAALGTQTIETVGEEGEITEGLECRLDNFSRFLGRDASGDLSPYLHLARRYRPVSPFPRIIRDIALFAPATATAAAVAEIIKKRAGSLLAAEPVLFDEYRKDGRRSLAFRLVFQSSDKTLTDEEVNERMAEIILGLGAYPGWQVRE